MMTTKKWLIPAALSSVFLLNACSDQESASKMAQTANEPAQQNTMDVKQPEPVSAEKAPLVEMPQAVKQVAAEAPALPEITPKAKPVEMNQAATDDSSSPAEVTEVSAQENLEKIEESVVAQVAPKVDGSQLYSSCASCHGAQGEGAIGPKLAGQTPEQIVDKLTRYKAGEQIGPLTGMMAPMAAPLSESDMAALGSFISTL